MFNKCKSSFAILCLILSASTVHAGYIDRKAEGWHFYEPMAIPKEKQEDEAKTEISPQTPEERLKVFKAEVERLKQVAVMEPTYENVKSYMTIQKELMDKGSAFAAKWMEVVFTTPKLDYSIEHPTSQAGRHVYLDQKQQQMDQEVYRLAQTHGLFFFVSSSCAYCKKFAPIVKAFAQKYGWEVMAVSTDGSTIPEFPNAVVDNGVASKLGVEFVPTLLAVNPQTEEVIPLSNGMSSQEQILDRIRVLIIERKNS